MTRTSDASTAITPQPPELLDSRGSVFLNAISEGISCLAYLWGKDGTYLVLKLITGGGMPQTPSQHGALTQIGCFT